MAQTTAVEYAINEILLQLQRNPIGISELFISRIEDEAKEIFKEQIKDAYWNGTIDITKEEALAEAEDFYKASYN